jgi:predicted transport protein
MVDIKLKRGEDDPQLIFESMNSTGKELSQADLIRNYILMRLEHEAQTRLYDRYWRPMELEFGQEAYGNHFDAFMRHFLTVKTGNIPKQGEVYEAFKVHARLNEVDLEGVEEVVQDIRTYARHYCAIALAKESDPELNAAFQDLRELSVDVAFPLLLELYQDYKDSRLSRDELLECVRLVEAYVFRRAICSIPTNSLNKTFATFGKSLRKEQYSASLKAHFLSLPAYRRFPTDDEFHREIQRKDLYNFTRCSYWLRRLENHTRRMGERVPVDELTIEHILPQNDDLAPQWRTDLGSDWKRIQQEWLHTLGNLTLTAYNSEYSDRPFKTKRDMPHAPEQALRRSPLFLNVGLGDLDAWNEDSIRVRAMHLADRALQVWGAPKLDLETLASLIPRLSVGSYTIQDHPNLSTTAMAPVFEAFRKSVLELNPCVTEEFLKLYVAYKAETNFVDIIPQVRRLLLSVNIPIQDLVDPKGRCVDVTGKGRWGNGKVELSLSTVEDLPYAVGIVRQALEYQLDTPESL